MEYRICPMSQPCCVPTCQWFIEEKCAVYVLALSLMPVVVPKKEPKLEPPEPPPVPDLLKPVPQEESGPTSPKKRKAKKK